MPSIADNPDDPGAPQAYTPNEDEIHEQQRQAAASQLTARDRCDRCGAQAYVKAEVGGGELLFCSHHAGRHEEAIAKIGSFIVDERKRLENTGAPAL